MESASAQWVNQTSRHTSLFYCVLNATRVYSFRVESVAFSGLGPVYEESDPSRRVTRVYMCARVTLGVGLPYQTDLMTLVAGISFCLHKPCKRVR
jgi:hypothetical protein